MLRTLLLACGITMAMAQPQCPPPPPPCEGMMMCMGPQAAEDPCPPPPLCLPAEAGPCPNFCPVFCGPDQVNCNMGPGPDGCMMPDWCAPAAAGCPPPPPPPMRQECPPPPPPCGDDMMMCMGPAGAPEDPCPPPPICLPSQAGPCPNFCPVFCGPDQVNCNMGPGPDGCMMPDWCAPADAGCPPPM